MHAGNPAPRLRIVLIALLLALAIGSVGQAPSVEAAPAGDENVLIRLYAEPVKGQHTICVGDDAIIRVRVLEGYVGGEDSSLGRLIGVEVAASVHGGGVGQISPAKNTTRINSDPIGVAYFTFSAEKPGEATVNFLGKLNTFVLFGIAFSSETVTDSVHLTVVHCAYDVQVISTFRAGMTSVGTSNKIIFLVDKERDESTFYVNWVTSALCGINSPISESKATVVTERVGDGGVKVDVTFEPSSSIGGGNCGSISVDTANSTDPILSALTITVPSSGGSDTMPQTVKAKNGSFTGSAFISVTPLYKK
jgi:hypothetical protein